MQYWKNTIQYQYQYHWQLEYQYDTNTDTIQNTTLWYDTIRYNTIHYDAIKCTALHYNTDRYNTTLHYNAIPIYNTIHNTIQYSTLQYNTIFYTTLQYRHSTISTVQCNTYSALHNTTLHHRKFPHAWSCTWCAIWKRHKWGSVHAVQRAVENVLETPSERMKVMLLEAGRNASRWAGKFWWISTMAAPWRYAPQGTHGMDPSGSKAAYTLGNF